MKNSILCIDEELWKIEVVSVVSILQSVLRIASDLMEGSVKYIAALNAMWFIPDIRRVALPRRHALGVAQVAKQRIPQVRFMATVIWNERRIESQG